MAGIGFELRKYLDKHTFLGTIQAYGYAGIIGAGPWVLSIIGVIIVGVLSVLLNVESLSISAFFVSTTWLMAVSLIITGCIMLLFVRFIADQLYQNKNDRILPNVVGLLILSTLVSGAIATLAMTLFFSDQSPLYCVLMIGNFVTLCNIWLTVIFTSGTKKYKTVLWAFFIGYLSVVVFSILMHRYGTEGLLTGLFIGHGILLFFMLTLIFKDYPGNELLRFDFIIKKNIYLRLIFIGFFFNAGIWIDKIIFWMTPATSSAIIGPLRASVIYDLPNFLAYLFIIPGMAVFLVKIETDFVEAYTKYYQAIKNGETLRKIEEYKDDMFVSVVEGLIQIIKVQGITVLSIFLLAPKIFEIIDISKQYLNLFYIDMIAVAFQVLLLSILNILFYLDRLSEALMVTFLLVVSNGLLTWFTLHLEPSFYGLGFCGSMLITTGFGYYILQHTFKKLEYYTFMMTKS
jgi:uncharacterized membrane protein